MKTNDGRAPERLVGGARPREAGERWLRRAFMDAAELTTPREESVPAFARRRTSRLPRRWLQLALAIAVVMIAGVTLAAFQRFVRPHLASSGAAAPPEREHAAARAHLTVALAPPSPEPAATAPEPVAPETPPAEIPAPAPRPRAPVRAIEAPRAPAALPLERPRWPEAARHAPRAPEEVAGEPPTEAHVLARALAHLRASRDAGAALADLDERDRLFPNGLLGLEALRIRAEALLDLGRDREALAALDGGRVALTPPLALVRGELRARDGRCPEALLDLGPIAGDAATPAALAERALYASASCHARLRDVAAARADLERYGARFPDGALRDQAAAFLRATAP
jgi:hypothetical protein